MSLDASPRRLILVLGDQLSPELAGLGHGDPTQDAVWMAEVEQEISNVPSHRLRIAVFLSAMRHHREALRSDGWTMHYHALSTAPSEDRGKGFAEVLRDDLRRLRPEEVVLTRPGDHRVLEVIRTAAEAEGVSFRLLSDDRFLCSLDDFQGWADGRERLVLEHFYRWMRKRTGILVTSAGKPVGGRWNYDADNREAFGREGPGALPERPRWPLDPVDREVVALVQARWPDHPGRIEHLDRIPRTAGQAAAALECFVQDHLPSFGRHQDAMWGGAPFLHHSRLSVPLNLGLLDPRVCIDAVLEAHARKKAPLNAVEGFVRQILGWREFVRGLYWREMPGYRELNALDAHRDVPSFLWDGETDMACVRDAMEGVLGHAYAHHIHRLMVLGLWCLLEGVDPHGFHEWHLAMYADAVDWVSLPNTLGMSQFGDGGIVGTKPYCASGRYIDRMSDHCRRCRYDPTRAQGSDACPFTTLYWDFLARHESALRGNHRMGFQYRNLDRKKGAELEEIRARARGLRAAVSRGDRI